MNVTFEWKNPNESLPEFGELVLTVDWELDEPEAIYYNIGSLQKIIQDYTGKKKIWHDHSDEPICVLYWSYIPNIPIATT